MHKKALLILNVGTPDAPTKKGVRKFLFQFLNDRQVIDIPWLLQKILVNGIIIPFRLSKSTKLYQKLWTPEGSPLLVNQQKLERKLQRKFRDKYTVYQAMRYGNPSLKKVLKKIEGYHFDELIVLPLYPQYATSTTQTTIDRVEKLTRKWHNRTQVRYIKQFYKNELVLDAFVERVKAFDIDSYDHIIFTYHGLPMRQVNKIHPDVKGHSCSCDQGMPAHGHKCYKATCYDTSRLLAKKLRLEKARYSVGFQSRLSNNWLMPFTDELIKKQAWEGHKRLLIISPSFVADCLETTVEVSVDYQELFQQEGGEHLQLVPALNDSDKFVEAIAQLIEE